MNFQVLLFNNPYLIWIWSPPKKNGRFSNPRSPKFLKTTQNLMFNRYHLMQRLMCRLKNKSTNPLSSFDNLTCLGGCQYSPLIIPCSFDNCSGYIFLYHLISQVLHSCGIEKFLYLFSCFPWCFVFWKKWKLVSTSSFFSPHYRLALYQVYIMFTHSLSSFPREMNFPLRAFIFKRKEISTPFFHVWRLFNLVGGMIKINSFVVWEHFHVQYNELFLAEKNKK